MASHHLTTPSESPRPVPGTPASKTREPVAQKVALLISVLVHGFAILFIGLSALLAPHRPSAVPIFEIVKIGRASCRERVCQYV